MKNSVHSLAVELNRCAHVISSSNGRHLASGKIAKASAASVTVKDGEARDKTTRDAFAFVKAFNLISAAAPELGDAVKVERQAIADAEKAAKVAKTTPAIVKKAA